MDQPTVLVVDDEPRIRDIVRRYLEADGFAVIELGDGPGALSAAREQRPDLIVLDVMLPGLDGVPPRPPRPPRPRTSGTGR